MDEFFPADSIQYLFPKVTHLEELLISGIDGELRLPQIKSIAGDIYFSSSGATATLIDLSQLTIDADNFSGDAFDNFNGSSTNAITYFNLGEYLLGDNLEFTADGAQIITSMPIVYDEYLELEVPNGSVTFNSPLNLDEDIALLLSGSDIILSIVDGDTNGYDITLASAGNILLDDLVDSDDLDLTASGTISLDALTTVSGDIYLSGIAIIEGGYDALIPQLYMNNVTGDLIMPSSGLHTVNVANFVTGSYSGNEIEALTVGSQYSNLDLSNAVFVNYIKNLSYTGSKTTPVSPGGQTNRLDISQTTSLTSVVMADSNHLSILSVVSNSLLASLDTRGVIITTEVVSNSSLTSLNLGHTYLNGDNALTLSVSNNHSITTLDLSTIEKVKTITIDNNTSLSIINGPGSSVLTEPSASISLTITNNAFQGTYQFAVDGSETKQFFPGSGSAAVVDAFRPFIDAYLAQTRTAAVSYTIGIDEVDFDADGEFDDGSIDRLLHADTVNQDGIDGAPETTDDQSDGGYIDTLVELDLFNGQ